MTTFHSKEDQEMTQMIDITDSVMGAGAAEAKQANPAVEGLASQSDDTLRAMIAEASALLESRAQERRKHALAEIQRLARETGLDVSVKKPARKRGRPKKSKNGS
jgi:hypothetical protein